MKNLERLKQEQFELKERLVKLMEFMNSEEFFSLPEGERQLLSSQRTGMEMYLNALTTRIYGNASEYTGVPSSILPLILGMMYFAPSPSKPTAVEELEKQIKENDSKDNK